MRSLLEPILYSCSTGFVLYVLIRALYRYPPTVIFRKENVTIEPVDTKSAWMEAQREAERKKER